MNEAFLSLLSFLISTTLSFFSLAFVIELVTFRIRKARVRSLLRLVPIANLFLDFFFSKLTTGNFLNPLQCESCIQKFLLSFAPELKQYLSHHQMAWSRYLAGQLPNLSPLVFAFCFCSLFFLLRKIWQIVHCNQELRALLTHAKPFPLSIHNQSLRTLLQTKKVKIWVSDQIQSPMAIYLRTILFPQHLLSLPQEEREAILAHELEHLRWKDPLIKLGCQIGSALFWWVPIHWYLKRIEQDQELAADASTQHHQLSSSALASALVKTAGSRTSTSLISAFAGQEILFRLQTILDPTNLPLQKNRWHRLSIFFAITSLITWGCMA